MRELIAITQLSLDGVMQAPSGPEEDPSHGFALGGWAAPYGDEGPEPPINELIAGDFALLLGRRTYETFAGYWPTADDNPIGKAFNRAPKYVATRTLETLTWANSRRLDDDVVAALRALKAGDGPPLHLWGSSNLLQTLLAADLVDEHRLWVFPVVLGGGKRLFEAGVPPRAMTLVGTRATPDGVLINTYRPAGAVRT